MNDIDFIKWVFDKAGMEYRDSINELSVCIYNNVWYSIGTLLFKNVFWSYALQRAIEGVNRNPKTTIDQRKDAITVIVWVTEEKYISAEYDLWGTELYSKEAALKYIYEQERC